MQYTESTYVGPYSVRYFVPRHPAGGGQMQTCRLGRTRMCPIERDAAPEPCLGLGI